jgi:leader peptidase (prepilin peptidase)/N-methyltransferase
MIFSSTLATAAFLFLLGLVLGSFYNVCIHRYLSGESIVSPGSHCPGCLTRLRWWENLPLASYVLLRGKCRSCGQAISLRYPAVELISGVWLPALYLEFGFGGAWAVHLVFGGLLIVVSFVDLESFVLPDVMVLPGAVGAFVCAGLVLDLGWLDSFLGAAAGAGAFLLLQKGYKLLKGIEGLGSGDIKLMLLLGALVGWRLLPLMVFLSALSGLAVSLLYILRPGGRGMQTAIPFGPFLSLGAMLTILWGAEIWQWYLY